jgi:hypothetical protein
MKNYLPLLWALLAAACGSTPEREAPAPPEFMLNDCALISVIGRDHYKLSAEGPLMRLRLNGEGLAWKSGCDWRALGFNVIEDTGPESRAAMRGFGEVSFDRPRYDMDGALIRTSITPAGAGTTKALCRLNRNEQAWSVETCGPDPRETQPRAAPPSPADATPESSRAPIPINPDTLPRDPTIPRPEPGLPPIGN